MNAVIVVVVIVIVIGIGIRVIAPMVTAARIGVIAPIAAARTTIANAALTDSRSFIAFLATVIAIVSCSCSCTPIARLAAVTIAAVSIAVATDIAERRGEQVAVHRRVFVAKQKETHAAHPRLRACAGAR